MTAQDNRIIAEMLITGIIRRIEQIAITRFNNLSVSDIQILSRCLSDLDSILKRCARRNKIGD